MATKVSYDYIVIGAGSAGCVVANRLSENGRFSVLLIEAGKHHKSIILNMPAALGLPLESTKFNWGFVSQPDKGVNGHTSDQHRGKVLGGSSSINGMVFVRGNPRDYERWAASGLPDWSYKHCLPYFRKMESFNGGDDTYRGRTGPLHVHQCKADNELYQSFLGAGQDYGLKFNKDQNGKEQEGVNIAQASTYKGERWSTARAYLDPIIDRKNLTIAITSLVKKVCIEGKKATGVIYESAGSDIFAEAREEVILCAGAFGSPQLLMLSGVGDSDELREHGIEAVHHLPGVGKDLQDHAAVPIQYTTKRNVSPTFQLSTHIGRGYVGARWLLAKAGLGASNYFEVGAFFKGNESADYANLQHEFFPMIGEFYRGQARVNPGFQYFTSVMRPQSRGSVTLRSKDPSAAPVIKLNFLDAYEDVRQLREGIKVTREMIAQRSWSALRGVEVSPGIDIQKDAEIEAWIRENAGTGYHAVSTCRMGVDDMAVTDNEGRVRGLGKLRVIDASVMPSLVTGNTNAPTIMLAEKLVDKVLGKALPPANIG